ncbi:hypothetical protein HY003_01455 [Candidatus Saccharibacteria bacterium]|nr:hypothetical protein [Candidatus Saccharibacteria bacterium]MBI3337942.1 hypothetical protein [Candidatus Saccharibacteria bacterium]
MKINGITKVIFVIFVIVVAIFGSLVALDVMAVETFKDSTLKVGVVSLIMIATSAVISLVTRK